MNEEAHANENSVAIRRLRPLRAPSGTLIPRRVLSSTVTGKEHRCAPHGRGDLNTEMTDEMCSQTAADVECEHLHHAPTTSSVEELERHQFANIT